MRKWLIVFLGIALVAGFSGTACRAEEYQYTAEFAEMDEIYLDVYINDPDELITDPDALRKSLAEDMQLAIPLSIDAFFADDDNPLPLLCLSINIFDRPDGGYYGMVELNLSRNTVLTGVADPEEFSSIVYSKAYCLTGDADPDEHIKEIAGDLMDEFVDTLNKAWY